MIRRYFPGGNTGMGFFNLFGNIVPDNANDHTIVLKGGPGVGKSTLMKRVGQSAIDKGYDVEFFYCSGDPDSLDGVRIPQKQLVILDGTAPHIVDPKLPGIDDEILNLGVHINSATLVPHRTPLKRLFEENSYQYTLAYSYLNTAMILQKSIYIGLEKICDFKKMYSHIFTLQPSQKDIKAHHRKLFINAITCKGNLNFVKDFASSKVYRVLGPLAFSYMNELADRLTFTRAELYYNPLTTTDISHIYLPEEDILFTTDNSALENTIRTIDTTAFLQDNIPEFVIFNEAQIETLISNTHLHLAKCKSLHDEIESYYINSIDFAGINRSSEYVFDMI